MPTRDFFRALSDLVGQGGSQRSIIAQIRAQGFRIANDRIRGLINQLRGRNLTAPQRRELTRIITVNQRTGPSVRVRVPVQRSTPSTGLSLTTEGDVSLPTAVIYRVRVTARYEVQRDEFGRDSRTLLRGTVSEVQTFKLPILEDVSRVLNNQAAARIEEEVLSRVRSAGLAQAGNYLTPDITAQSIEVLNATLTDFR